MACAINLGSSVTLTGGSNYPYTGVSEYNKAGWVRDLPPLQQERWTNGCCYYNNEEETKVTIDINYSPIIIQSGS